MRRRLRLIDGQAGIFVTHLLSRERARERETVDLASDSVRIFLPQEDAARPAGAPPAAMSVWGFAKPRPSPPRGLRTLESAASDAFELSYMVHMTALMIPATLHTLSSWTHPGTAHAFIATMFGGGAMVRTVLHFSGLKVGEATRVWHQTVVIAAVATTFAIYATGRTVPLTAMDLTFVAFCFVMVIFGLIALSNFPAYVLICFVGSHIAVIPVFVVDDDALLPGRSAALLLGAVVVGVVAGLRVRTMFGLYAPPVSSAQSAADRPTVLAVMCDELAAGMAKLGSTCGSRARRPRGGSVARCSIHFRR